MKACRPTHLRQMNGRRLRRRTHDARVREPRARVASSATLPRCTVGERCGSATSDAPPINTTVEADLQLKRRRSAKTRAARSTRSGSSDSSLWPPGEPTYYVKQTTCWTPTATVGRPTCHNAMLVSMTSWSVSSSRSATCRLTTATSTSVRMTRCRRSRRRCGSWRCATGTVRPKRQRPRLPGSGVPGLPDRREWPVWTAAQMRAADEYLQEAGAAMTESGAARRQQRVSAGP